MFSEFVDDFSLDVKVWPRAAALAERLWANPSTNAISAEYRYHNYFNCIKTKILHECHLF